MLVLLAATQRYNLCNSKQMSMINLKIGKRKSMGHIQATKKSTADYAGGREFGEYGSYVIEEFTLEYSFDPNHESNAMIVDIDKARKDEHGHVLCNGNAFLIYPKTVSPSALLVDVPNRGRPTVFSLNRPKAHELQQSNRPVGDEFLFRHGFAVLSIGWQFDAPGMRLNVPYAFVDNNPVVGNATWQAQPGSDATTLPLAANAVSSYPVDDERLLLKEAALYERPHTQCNPTLIDPSSWMYGYSDGEMFIPKSTHLTHKNGFKKGRVYTFVYRTARVPVVGLGLLAIREATTHFKHDYEWPIKAPEWAIGYGASQTGRFLRHFLYEGLNEDSEGREVFDLLIPHIAGGQRGDFNHRCAIPGSMGVPAIGQQFPFSTVRTHDELSGKTAGLLDKCKSRPKVISTNTSWEYWRGDAALTHVTTDGRRDVDLDENERIYMFAGTHHINGILPLTDKLALIGEQVRYPLNTVSYTPLLRAVLINGLKWIADKEPPPKSQYPRITDGTLVTRQQVIDAFENSSYFRYLPETDYLTGLWHTDLGEHVEEGICKLPAKLLERYPTLVSNVGEDLNEIAGIQLPEVSIPIGVHSGWNPRHPSHGAPEQTATFVGFSMFDNPDTVPQDKEACQVLVEQVTNQLVESRYVLEEDRSLVINSAMKRHEVAMSVLTAKPQE